MAAQYFSQKLENHATEQHKSLEHCALKQNDYVSSCGIPLMPVVYQVEQGRLRHINDGANAP